MTNYVVGKRNQTAATIQYFVFTYSIYRCTRCRYLLRKNKTKVRMMNMGNKTASWNDKLDLEVL